MNTNLKLTQPQANTHNASSLPSDPQDYYKELTSRNKHFISPSTQEKLRRFKITVAGCGSTGGACIESLARVGVQHFILADNGAYELNNLNRQHALIDNIGQNKALFHAEQLKKINPFVKVHAFSEGVNKLNVHFLVSNSDLIMDGVDVTTYSGMQMKIALHETAKKLNKPVLTALDMGYCQWGHSYDYRNSETQVLSGVAEQAKQAKNPMKALFSFVPISAIPDHVLELVKDLFENPDQPASQLGCTSDLLASIIVPSVIRFVETGEVVPGWNIDLTYLAKKNDLSIKKWIKHFRLKQKIKQYLKKID